MFEFRPYEPILKRTIAKWCTSLSLCSSIGYAYMVLEELEEENKIKGVRDKSHTYYTLVQVLDD